MTLGTIPDLFIADLDGTLIDSQLDFSAIRKAADIPDSEDILAHIETLPPDAQKQKMNIVHEFEMKGLEEATLLPGVEVLFNWLRTSGIPLAICTRNSAAIANAAVERFGMPVGFVCAREQAIPKPAPDGLNLILDQYSCEARNAIYIGDYLFDLLAAEAADIPFILFYQDEAPSYADRAQFVMNDFHELVNYYK